MFLLIQIKTLLKSSSRLWISQVVGPVYQQLASLGSKYVSFGELADDLSCYGYI
jgi:hypothetical protein